LTRVLLIAPIPALRLGLRALLADSDVQIVGEADRLDSPDLSDAEVDVVIHASASASFLDLGPDSVPGAAILALTEDRPTIQALARAGGAWGALPLETSREELLAAIHALAEGLVVSAPQFINARPARSDDSAHPALSEREIEVLGLLAQGRANKQIAAELGISEHTVKFHVSSVFTKLNVTNRAEAVRQGVRGGWIAV
jgi:DNA-binding NarL/FixJ family response regulator